MSGQGGGELPGSKLSVSARRASGVGGEEDAPPSPLARRVAMVDLTPADASWAPVASTMSGEIQPLDDVLDRLVTGLAYPR